MLTMFPLVTGDVGQINYIEEELIKNYKKEKNVKIQFLGPLFFLKGSRLMFNIIL